MLLLLIKIYKLKVLMAKIKGGNIMPRRDKTGPTGGGSRTGRGLGPCKPTKKSAPTRKSTPKRKK
jgi:hypothetical protein